MASRDQFYFFCLNNQNLPGLAGRLYNYYYHILSPGPKPPLIWLEANACSGDSISTLNSVDPELGQILCSLVEVRYWNALMPGQGQKAQEQLFTTVETGDFILIVEGAIATAGDGRFTVPFKSGEYLFTSQELLLYLAPKAKYIIAAGTCAAFGGPSANISLISPDRT